MRLSFCCCSFEDFSSESLPHIDNKAATRITAPIPQIHFIFLDISIIIFMNYNLFAPTHLWLFGLLRYHFFEFDCKDTTFFSNFHSPFWSFLLCFSIYYRFTADYHTPPCLSIEPDTKKREKEGFLHKNLLIRIFVVSLQSK